MGVDSTLWSEGTLGRGVCGEWGGCGEGGGQPEKVVGMLKRDRWTREQMGR